MGEVRAKLDRGAIVWTIFIIWSIFTSIQMFSLIHCYHLSTTPATFNTSDSVAALKLTATLARINKRKWSLRKRKNHTKLFAIAEDFRFSIQGSPALWQPFFPNKLHRQTFLKLQYTLAPEEELCFNDNSAFRGRNPTKFWIFLIIVIQISSLFIHVSNFKITITNLNSKFCTYYLKSWYFPNNSVYNFL